MSKAKKRFLIISAIIVTIVLVLVFAINGIIAGIIKDKVDTYLKMHPVKNYHLTYDRIGFNLLNRSLRVIDLTYAPDNNYLDSLAKTGYKFMIPEVNVDKFIISGINFKKAIKDKFVNIGNITIKRVHVRIYKIDGNTSPEKVKKESTEKSRRSSFIPDSLEIKGLNGLRVDNFKMIKSRVEIYNVKKKKTILSEEKVKLTVNNINLNKSSFNNGYLYTGIGDILLKVGKIIFRTPDNLYEISFNNLQTTFKDEAVSIKGFHYKPLYSKKDFSKQIKYQKERYDIQSKEVLISHPDYAALFLENKLEIHKIILEEPTIEIYRDKRIPFPHFKRPLLPHQALKKMALKLNIDSVQVNNATFSYEEKTDLNSGTLQVNFQKLSAAITNICNIKEQLALNDMMKVVLKGKLMGAAPFTVKMIFPMRAVNDTFVFAGAVFGKVPLNIFNKAIYPAAGIKFDDGYLDKLTFKGGANSGYSTGTMTMLYHDMKIHVLKDDEASNNKFLSWGATAMARNNNPLGKKPPKIATLAFERDMEKGFGNFFWKTILSGLKGTMIISMNTMNKNKANSLTKPATTKKNSNSKSTSKKKKRKKWFKKSK